MAVLGKALRCLPEVVRSCRYISQKPAVVQRIVMKKMKRGIDRLPSQGPDPASKFKNGWQLAAAAVLERYPVVIPEPDPFEAEYLEGRFLDQQKKGRPAPPEWFLSEKDILMGKTEPSEDDHGDMYEPAPRITEADRTNDTKSIRRALDQRLYFVVKRSEKSKTMQFPQVLATDPSITMREYTKQALENVIPVAHRPSVHYMAYTPACHFEHVFTPQYQEKHDVYGLKIFFYRVMLLSGDIKQIRQAADYSWATDSELPELFSPEYYKAIKPILFGVGP